MSKSEDQLAIDPEFKSVDEGAETDVVDQDDTFGSEGSSYRFSRRLSVLSDPLGVESSAVGALRNHLDQQHLRAGRRSLAICSVGPHADRALVACNLAIASAQAGAATVLVDANFREPGVGSCLVPPESAAGLGDYLDGSITDPSEILRTEVVPNLTVIHAGKIPADPQSALAGERFELLLTNLMRNFAFTVVDCPASSLSADARRIASILRYALIVVKQDVTYVDDVKQLIEELRSDRVSIIGTYLNVD